MNAANLCRALLLASIILCPSAAQISATLTGQVRDSSEAAIVNAQLAATHLESGVVHNTKTNERGSYRIVSLPPGQYRVEIRADGFKTAVHEPVLISTGATTTLDSMLVLGAIQERVTVNAAAPLLNMEDATLGTVVEKKMIEHLPVQLSSDLSAASGRRQPTTFMNLTPGADGTEYNKAVNGMEGRSTEVDIEGGAVEAPNRYGTIGNAAPPYDAVQEFAVIQGIPDAEDGNGSSVVKLTLKSGTNSLHGSGFDLVRNDIFDARGFFARTVPVVRQNEYGFTVGGPVFLPKIYNGQNKTFFFFAFTQFKVRGGGTAQQITMPTAAMKTGDFSGLTDNVGAQIPIFDPASAVNDGRAVRTQFPGNIIPASRINPSATKFAALMPTAELNRSFNNLPALVSRVVNDTDFSIKIDHNFSGKHRLSGSYWRARADVLNYRAQPGVTNDGTNGQEQGGGVSINYMWVVTPSVTNEARVGWSTSDSLGSPLPGVIQEKNYLNLKNFPLGEDGRVLFGLDGYSRTNSGFFLWQGNPHNGTRAPSYGYRDTLTWVKRNHIVKAGFDINQRRYNQAGFDQLSDNFSRSQTSQPSSANYNRWGDSFASFLLGDVYNQDGQQLGTPSRSVGRRYSWFIQDHWKVAPKLTLSLGLRHDIAPAGYLEGGTSLFVSTLPNPGAGGRPGALGFFKEGVYPTHYGQFGPRLGFAYRAGTATVIRGGYAFIHQVTRAELFVNRNLSQGFTSNLQLPNQFTWVPVYNIWRDGPFTDPNLAKLPNLDPAQVNNSTIQGFDESAARSTRVQQWTLSVQRELPRHIVLEARYVGWKAQGLYSSLQNLNQLSPAYWQLGNLLTANASSAQAAGAGIALPYPGFSGTVAQALRAYPQYASIAIANSEALGQAQYHGAQFQIQNRLSQSLLFMANYVFCKTVSDTGNNNDASSTPIDAFNRALEKAAQPIPPHVVKITWVYELPFGRGRRFLNKAPRAVDLLLGGWNAAAAQAYSSGGYLGVSGGRSTPFFASSTRPDRVPGQAAKLFTGGKFDPAVNRYANINAFAPSPLFTVGNAPRLLSDLRGFAGYSENLSLTKSFPIVERLRVEIRGEFFNLFNRVRFGTPATNINTAATFGTVTSAGTPRQMQFMFRLVF